MRYGENRLKYLILCAVWLVSFALMPLTQAAVPILPLTEVPVGAHGVARTVIAGTLIEEFGVEILAIMKNKGAVGDLILVRTYGDVIDRAGGVAQGMSGSPVFIGGRLIGAIGYGWSLTDQRTAMVTPIEDMLKLLEPAPAKPEKAEAVQQPVVEKTPLATPLMAAGFGQTALNFLNRELKPLKLTPVAAGDPRWRGARSTCQTRRYCARRTSDRQN